MTPQKIYFIVEKENILKEIEAVKRSKKYALEEAYFEFNESNLVIIFLDLEQNEDIWDLSTNFIDYSNDENDKKIESLCSLWNKADPDRVLPPILDWNEKDHCFTILDGFNRARLFSNAFAGDDLEGAMVFIMKQACFEMLQDSIKKRIQLII